MADSVKVNKKETSVSSTLIESVNKFALNLYKKLATCEENTFFSPFNISTAVSMLLYGAKGDTALELRNVLNFDVSKITDIDILEQFDLLLASLSENRNSCTFSVANAVTVQKGLHLSEDYVAKMSQYYRAMTTELDFMNHNKEAVDKINSFVKEATKNMIPKVFESLDPSTIMVLLSVIYFKGMWLNQFDPKKTYPQSFYCKGFRKNKNVPMMYLKSKFLFTETDSYKAVELPYKNEEVAMLFILPHKKDGIENLRKMLSVELISNIKSSFHKVEVEVTIPKFRLEYSKELKPVFQELGVLKIFGGANFRGMSNAGMRVSKIIHKAVIDVNEEGSEAAAVTAIVMSRCAMRIREFRADHPFLFLIYDKRNELILFMGEVEEL